MSCTNTRWKPEYKYSILNIILKGFKASLVSAFVSVQSRGGKVIWRVPDHSLAKYLPKAALARATNSERLLVGNGFSQGYLKI